MKFIDELFAGREVVAIAADISSDSSIFWADAGGVFSFSRSLGECRFHVDTHKELTRSEATAA